MAKTNKIACLLNVNKGEQCVCTILNEPEELVLELLERPKIPGPTYKGEDLKSDLFQSLAFMKSASYLLRV